MEEAMYGAQLYAGTMTLTCGPDTTCYALPVIRICDQTGMLF
jgi:hypothetical protein